MANSISISDLSIKVKLNSREATRGLTQIRKHLAKIQRFSTQSLKDDEKRLKFVNRTNLGLQRRIRRETELGKVLQRNQKALGGKAIGGRTGRQRGIGVGGITAIVAGAYAVAQSFQGILSSIQAISRVGMEIESSFITLNAAVGGSTLAGKAGPGGVKLLQKDQANFVKRLTMDYGLTVDQTTREFSKFFAASSNELGAKGSQGLFEGLSQLGIVYGLDNERMGRAMTAFTQMASKGQVMAEELKQQLGDVLPGSMQIFARAATETGKWGEVTVDKLYDLMEKGQLKTKDLLPAVTKEMKRMVAADGALEKALMTTKVKEAKMKTAFQYFSKGAFNQFKTPLAAMYEQITDVLYGKGLQSGVGLKIRDMIIFAKDELLGPFFKDMEELEKRFSEAGTTAEKKLIASEVWGKILGNGSVAIATGLGEIVKVFKDAVVNGLNSITEEDIKTFSDAMKYMLGGIIVGALEVVEASFGAFFKVIRFLGGFLDDPRKDDLKLLQDKILTTSDPEEKAALQKRQMQIFEGMVSSEIAMRSVQFGGQGGGLSFNQYKDIWTEIKRWFGASTPVDRSAGSAYRTTGTQTLRAGLDASGNITNIEIMEPTVQQTVDKVREELEKREAMRQRIIRTNLWEDR